MAAMSSFLESVELAEDFASSSSGSRSIHGPRISFSNEFVQLSEDPQPPQQQQQIKPQIGSIHNPSSSGEFEFTMNASSAAAATAPVKNHPLMLSADELFYKGKLLPLHLPPRIRMVQDLSENPPNSSAATSIGKSPPLAVMRRERSLRSPAKPSVIASTLKSSSYPPPGYSSRPSSPPKSSGKCASGSSNSRWRDLFGLKKSISSPKSGAPSSSVPTKLLKMIFNRGGSSSGNGTNPSIPAAEIFDPGEAASSSGGGSEALLPLLRDQQSSCDDHPEMAHSSSVSSSASSNWTASSASSSNASTSSFSADFPENVDQLPKKCNPRGTSRGTIGPAPCRPRRSAAAQTGRYGSAAPQTGKSGGGGGGGGGGLQRSGSGGSRRPVSSTGARMQLQDHVLIGKARAGGAENSWRRPADHHKAVSGCGGSTSGPAGGTPSSYSSSVRVTPVLHVPACIGPSLRNVRVHGLKRLFSSSSSAPVV